MELSTPALADKVSGQSVWLTELQTTPSVESIKSDIDAVAQAATDEGRPEPFAALIEHMTAARKKYSSVDTQNAVPSSDESKD